MNTHGLEVGDTFVLCDAGGGTVDLISYTITALLPKLQIKEAAPGTGDFCGAAYLDESFSNYLDQILSNEPGWDSEVLADAMSQFNTVIIGFIHYLVEFLTRHRSSGSSRPPRHRQMGTASLCPVSRITIDLEYGGAK